MGRKDVVALLSLFALALIAAPAGAKPVPLKPPAKVAIGRPAIGTSPNGLASILVPVRYPIQLAGRVVETRVALLDPDGKTIRSWVLHERLSSGRIRRPTGGAASPSCTG